MAKLWHCYQWVGRPIDVKDEQRRDPRQAVPPLVSRDWFRKPGKMRRASFEDLAEAQAWVREAMRKVEKKLPESITFLSSLDDQAAGVARAAAGSAWRVGVWTAWQKDPLGGRSTMIELAIVGQ